MKLRISLFKITCSFVWFYLHCFCLLCLFGHFFFLTTNLKQLTRSNTYLTPSLLLLLFYFFFKTFFLFLSRARKSPKFNLMQATQEIRSSVTPRTKPLQHLLNEEKTFK